MPVKERAERKRRGAEKRKRVIQKAQPPRKVELNLNSEPSLRDPVAAGTHLSKVHYGVLMRSLKLVILTRLTGTLPICPISSNSMDWHTCCYVCLQAPVLALFVVLLGLVYCSAHFSSALRTGENKGDSYPSRFL
ncbi:uncharacterized protein BT62DRAFT_1079104 [Guyanagaster necrorhizus]|uniref:Uncharacterized protein n=1 Tax=Guyanagaster necrorhizus TaxID=856835 RepID=A0A9P8APA2_9AGAR|nr:uncharacterized protein BT62DRAFT_1079104 [Guyanagaster necrorhizus MCA 3950]KAG7442730.1 hypothetical protein BT62DRAFT_1079104 [Guyanagaster necrorhizus MCA 3950]